MNPALTHIHDTLHAIETEIEKEIIGQNALIEKLLITIFAWGHALLEGVPGLGKTKTIRTLSKVLGLDTKRISFTPDLLPSDLTGNEVYRPQKWDFYVRKWPVFTNILLADEINRTPPKVQSALLEAMEEKKMTIWETTFDLPSPFFVFATQNPLEHEGTYPLPEAQLDRFLMRIILDNPSIEDEKKIFMKETRSSLSSWETKDLLRETNNLKLLPSDFLEMTDYIARYIRVDEKIYDYISDILSATREGNFKWKWVENEAYSILSYWASTRAGLALIRAGRVRALIVGRNYMMPEDVKFLAHDIIDHRIGLSYEAISEWITTHQVTASILESVKVP